MGRGALDALVAELVREPPGRSLVVVSDDRVGPLHARPLADRLAAAGLDASLVVFAEGEASKTRETKAWIEDRLLEAGTGRDAALVAVGGGVVGDLAGFTAATWHRGIPVVQVPTSLVAMVDSALGGKTAVNLPQGKNLVGCFHQPHAIYADVSLLETLEEDRYVEGFAEVVKSAAIADAAFFGWLERSVDALRGRSGAALERVVRRCVEIKARVVRRDEREAGRRAVLNFGHTVAHALEAASGYAVRHGPAVAIGLSVESRLAQRMTGFSRRQVARVERLVEALGLSAHLGGEPPAEALVEAARRDKKNREGRIRCALPLRLGRMRPGDDVTVAVDDRLLLDTLRESGAD